MLPFYFKNVKKPIALILTDTHLKESNIDVNKSIYKQAIKIAKSLGLSKIIHAGDIFDSRKSQTQDILIAFTNILNNFTNENIKLCAIKGNHDCTDYGSWESFLAPFESHNAFDLIPKYANYTDTSIKFQFLSYFKEEIYIEYLKTLSDNLDKNVKNVLITHIDICGGKMNNGIEINNKITTDLFKKWDKVLVGHWHDFQVMDKGRIMFISASLQHNFGESENKGATILYDDLSTEIVLLDFPKYKTFILNTDIHKTIDISECDITDNLRVILTGKEENVKSFDKSKMQAMGIKVALDSTSIEVFNTKKQNINFDKNSLVEEFKTFCIQKEINYEEGLNFIKLAL